MDPSMIGYQKILNDIGKETNECKQMQVTILDTKIQTGPDITSITFTWEKRCLLLPSMTPQFFTGQSTVLMHLGANGWTYAALTGAKLFNPPTSTTSPSNAKAAYTLAQLTVTNPWANLYARSVGGVLAFPITLTDPDLAGSTSVAVTLKTNAAIPDTLIVTLLPLTTGSSTFSIAAVNLGQAKVVGSVSGTCSGPSLLATLELCPVTLNGVPTGSSITVSYTDTTTPSGVAQVVSKTIIVN
jgi:hypothetical protein